ncbi:MAG: LptF/LptG family permease [Desulfobacterales bacterium]|nr:LptF/LptG family permease [Desulfobacterales bacterium]
MSIFLFDGGELKEQVDAEQAVWEETVEADEPAHLRHRERKDRDGCRVLFKGRRVADALRGEMWRDRGDDAAGTRLFSEAAQRDGVQERQDRRRHQFEGLLPLINFFMMLLGISLSLGGTITDRLSHALTRHSQKDPSGGSGIIAAGLGLLISALYWLGYSFFLSLGYAGVIPAYAAPWIMPVLFSAASMLLYRQIPE